MPFRSKRFIILYTYLIACNEVDEIHLGGHNVGEGRIADNLQIRERLSNQDCLIAARDVA